MDCLWFFISSGTSLPVSIFLTKYQSVADKADHAFCFAFSMSNSICCFTVNGLSPVKADISTPGHVFPLKAKDGGVLVRAGHTEAAVDISRLAGLNPSGVICEIMNDDGTMAKGAKLLNFGKRHKRKNN